MTDDRFWWLYKQLEPRLQLAKRRATELDRSIRKWRSGRPCEFDWFVKEPPECGWYIEVTRVRREPDLYGWGLQFAEVAHHMRSVLNTALARVVIAEGGVPSKSLQYPIALTRRAWRKSERRRVAELPERVQRAIYASQPFLHAENSGTRPENNVLAVLAWFNNQDKHRMELVGELEPSAFEQTIRIETSNGWVNNPPGAGVYDWSLLVGSRLVDVDTTPTQALAIKHAEFDLSMEVVIADELGARVNYGVLLEELFSAYLDALHSIVAAWSKPDADLSLMSGWTDHLPGAAFGRGAVDALVGPGTWDSDFARRGPRESAARAFDEFKLDPEVPLEPGRSWFEPTISTMGVSSARQTGAISGEA